MQEREQIKIDSLALNHKFAAFMEVEHNEDGYINDSSSMQYRVENSYIDYRMSLSELRYDAEWNWLMPVIEKLMRFVATSSKKEVGMLYGHASYLGQVMMWGIGDTQITYFKRILLCVDAFVDAYNENRKRRAAGTTDEPIVVGVKRICPDEHA